MKFVAYSAVAVAFLAGWAGTSICVRSFIISLIPDAYDDSSALVGWLALPGSVLGLPIGFFFAYMIAAGFKGKGRR